MHSTFTMISIRRGIPRPSDRPSVSANSRCVDATTHMYQQLVHWEVELGTVLNTSIHTHITSTQNALSSGHDISRMHAEINDQPSRIINCN